jgi:Tfp pilus assembly protein PilN
MKANKLNSQTGILWHPNFRVVATLPDTKVIRTSFLINGAAVALVLSTAVFMFLREQETADIRAQAAAWTERIQAGKPAYDKAVKLQKDFSEAEKRVKEIESFVTCDHVASLFLRRVAETLPRYCTIDAVEMYGQGVRLKGSIVGTPVKVPEIATAYVKQLEADAFFSSQLQSVKLDSLDPEKDAGRMLFVIGMKFKSRTESDAKAKPRK